MKQIPIPTIIKRVAAYRESGEKETERAAAYKKETERAAVVAWFGEWSTLQMSDVDVKAQITYLIINQASTNNPFE